MKAANHFQPMDKIKQMLAVIGEVIPPGSEIVYLDYPVYDNIGDLLIMKGAEAFFRDYGITVRKRYSYVNFRQKMAVEDHWIIVCQGGGNFGDLYPHHQRLREKALKAFPRNRIVILPQTIHFNDPAEERRSLLSFSAHPDLHLFVRDERSYKTASSFLANVYLAPDMAHQLYPIPSNVPGTRLRLGLLRKDQESAEQEVILPCDKVADWPQLFTAWDRWLLRQIIKGYSLDRRLGNILPLRSIWHSLAEKYVARAIVLFSGYDEILTSRLHGHILACLMGKPNLLLDNSYGKNMSYYRLWTYRLEGHSNEASAGNYVGDLYPQSS
ncbi:polysaccharide pyruvyl transferase family protein [Cohnella mopanensis]|uniref:polysaccharide pyruvyl transferase family protein n=1 Tax=Cohnella mopanensis TaxID=2911966 RepID=UPI001EF8A62C|nr:polysaccharide pyruvyl transferase family protein [Cohnella mopanensis]